MYFLFIEILNEKENKEACNICFEVEKYNGKFLVRGGNKITTEGNEFVRTAIIEFSSFNQAKIFFYSTEYQEAHNLLKDTVVRHHQIIEGS